MARLEGIIYSAFGNYIVLRGFAPIMSLARISKKPASYQRDANNQHKIDIVNYLADLKSYFPEITLACRVNDYDGLLRSIGDNKDVGKSSNEFVKGLRILSERLPIGRDRARHAYIEIINPTDEDKLLRVDGNHRLEPFDKAVTDISWWHQFVTNREAIKDETDPERRKGWLDYQAELFKKKISSKIVPFTIILSDATDADNFEAKIFHDINFKALPLREEASLKIISELNAFDREKLGPEYPLALDLIKIIKTGQFNMIPWLNSGNEDSRSYYRTACLSIVRLLISRKEILYSQSRECDLELEKTKRKIIQLEAEINALEEKAQITLGEIQRVELDQGDFEKKVTYKELKSDLSKIEGELKIKVNDQKDLEYKQKHLNYKVDNLSYYVQNCENEAAIIEALTSLISVYKSFNQKAFGNIAFLCALVYYAILDKMQMQSFIDWAERNGINKITEPDDLSKDSATNLINMFEQIYQAKKNQIFISMQFGDSQSELIYEKITRAIEKFNEKHKSIHLNATPIRVDRTVESSTFSIQDRILEAIKSCSLIIADLSSSNINVYLEIGYAMGVAESHNMIPNMILLYKEDTDHNKEKKDVDKFIGFNLRNLSQLRFKDYKQLVDGLVDRLEKHYGV